MKVVDGHSSPGSPGGADAPDDDPFPCDPGWTPPDAVALICDADAMVAVFAAERYRRVAAYRREALADAAGRGLVDVAERAIRLELAAALRITEQGAGQLIAHAHVLETRYPAALDALAAARVTQRHVQVLIDLLDPLTPAESDTVLPRAIELAEAEPVGTFRRRLRALIDQVRVQTLPDRHERALQERRVFIEPADDGMAWLTAYLPAVEAHAIHARLTAIAKTVVAGDPDARDDDAREREPVAVAVPTRADQGDDADHEAGHIEDDEERQHESDDAERAVGVRGDGRRSRCGGARRAVDGIRRDRHGPTLSGVRVRRRTTNSGG